ncbi:Na+/H+ antiporter NhaA [Brevibacterium sp. VCM10]|uniref:Na+/H+ antiporter NhaA n=1 Tax=Brevibacterium sp. VCM10 TaxID=1381751 RepID=UPI0004AEC8F3|nr:Na+/H+ antiporter NhaA [Brevibacterium sp. VCM10]
MSGLRQRFQSFLAAESSGAIMLLGATLIALLWANLGSDSYDGFWHTEVGIAVGDGGFHLSLQHWINDGLMAIFFFLVSLEVKKDFVLGELHDLRRASLPIFAAVGGLAIPAVLFVVINWGTAEVGAWGTVISTDTAFVVGILAAFGSRIPVQLRIFLLALAVVDDIGALAVIAVVYTEALNFVWVGIAVVIAVLIFAAQRLQTWRAIVYVVLGSALWVAVYQSGIHATIAGVVTALLLPVFPPQRERVNAANDLTSRFRRSPDAARGKAAVEGILSSVSINDRFQLNLARAVTFIVVPLFALSNAGVEITGESLGHAFASTLMWGVVVSLVVGKFIGVFGAAYLGKLLKIGEMPPALRGRHIASGSLLTGIGFTISLFIVDLAIDDPVAQSDARIGILLASVIAAGLGFISLTLTARYDEARAPERQRLERDIDPARDHCLGDAHAPYSLVEYGSFGGLDDLATEDLVQRVRDHFDEDLIYVFRHLPPTEEAPDQTPEALEAVAAQSPELFWSMRSQLNEMSEQEAIDNRSLLRATVNVGANLSRVEEDLRRSERRARVNEDFVDAESMGITSGPGFFVNGLVYTGELEPEAIIAEIEETRTAETDSAEAAAAGTGASGPASTESTSTERHSDDV